MVIKPVYMAAALLAFLYWRHNNKAALGGVTRTEESLSVSDGTNFQADLWGTLSGKNLTSQNFSNILPGSANADPGGSAAAKLGLLPSWDGSLP